MKHAASSKRPRPPSAAAGAQVQPTPTMPWLQWAEASQLFPTVVSAAWFLREHKRELAERGVLLKISRQWHVLMPEIGVAVQEIGKRIARASATGAAERAP